MDQRATAIHGIWQRVNDIATTTEDSDAIRALIAEAGIAPDTHVGADPASLTPLMVAEWVLGQWADMIDAGSPFLNSGRNVSLFQFDKYGDLLLGDGARLPVPPEDDEAVA